MISRLRISLGLYCRLAGVVLLAGCGPAPVRPPGGAPVRVVSLAPNVTEIVCAVGAAEVLVGRSSACRYPAAVTNVPVAGDFGVPALEAIAQLAPTHVLVVDLAEKNSVVALERLGVKPVRLSCRRLEDIARVIREVGVLVGRPEAGERLAGEFEGRLAELRQQAVPARRPRVFVELWADPLMTVGRESFVSELVELAGGWNVTGDVARDYFVVGAEVVLARDPEVVVQLEPVPPDVRLRPGWSQVTAVRENRICAGVDRDLVQVPGPRVLEAVAQLRRCWEP